MPRRLSLDMWLFGAAVALLSMGIVMVYSASAIVAADRFHDPYFFLKRQLFWAVLGAGCLWLALRMDYRWLERLALPLLVLAGVLLVLVLVPPLGQSINGTRRWLRLGVVSFQPVELAKLALVVYLAAFLAPRGEVPAGDVRRGLLPPVAVAGALAALVLVQPDLGNCLTLIVLTFALLYLAGMPQRYLGWALAGALPLLAAAIWVAPYRLRRIMAFWDPWSDPRGSGFQIIQSWLAFGNGGVLGQGIGGSRQKLFYLPEAHTDFIFAIVGEELGLLGALTIVGLFAVLVWRGLRIGLRAPEPFGAYLALGITVLIATQTLVNLGVVTGLLPTKGLPLPFLSFGGSALLMTMAATGVLLNISQQQTHV
jgi:cell division protein FtsW